MKIKIPPVAAILILLAAIGSIAAIVWTNIERRPPPLPIGPPAAMGEQMAKQKKPDASAASPAFSPGKHSAEKQSSK